MNARERFLSTMRFEEIDRPFRWEAPAYWSETIVRWRREGLPESANYRNLLDSAVARHFGMDPLVWLPVEGGWTGTPFSPMFEVEVLEERGENIVVRDADGIVKLVKRESADSSMPAFIRFPVQNRADFDEVKWRLDPRSRERLPSNWQHLKAVLAGREYPLGMFVIGSFGHPRNLMGDEVLMCTMHDDPRLIHDIMAHWLEFYKGYVALVCEDVVPDFILIWEDMCYVNGPLISPAMFAEFMVPYLADLIAHAKALGIGVAIVDTDGDCRKLLPHFLSTGVDAFFPFEVQSGMDIVEIRKQYGKRFAMLGGLDKRALAVDEEAIRREVDAKVPFMLGSGGYVPGLDHSCPPNVPLHLFEYFVEYTRTKGAP